MNIGTVIELDFGDVADPTERYERIRKNVADRLHEIPVLTQRVIRAPFDLTWPALVPDSHIDLDRHISRVALPSPGSGDQFDALISEFLSRPLVRTRPLWQLLIIEGLADGRVAAALKVHHALADGVSGAETFASLFDISPEVRAPLPATDVVDGDEGINSKLLVLDGLRRLRAEPALVISTVTSWLTRVFNVVSTVARVILTRDRKRATPRQPSIFEARRTSLNGRAGVEKIYHRMRVPLADAKRAAKYHGASVTDFVTATTSGALRRLLEDRGDELQRDLIAFVPVNVRGEGDTSAMGNQISGMLVALHTDIDDPIERLAAIARDSAKTVGVQRHRGAQMFQEMPRVLGPTVLSYGAKMVDAFGLFDVLPPMANLMLSSVPGPPIPLWLSGHRVVSAAPVGPLLGPFSLNVTVLGFEQNLEFGMLGCANAMPDLAKLRDYLVEEATKLIDTVSA
jgi:WS/DGAT/MGAT family acyltransferase